MSEKTHNWAVPGARCVCVEPSDHDWSGKALGIFTFLPSDPPAHNQLLTVREVVSDEHGLHLTFWELPLRQRSGTLAADIRWGVDHFRPIVSRETDISVFKRLVKPLVAACAG